MVFPLLGVCPAEESFPNEKEGEIGHLYHSLIKLLKIIIRYAFKIPTQWYWAAL